MLEISVIVPVYNVERYLRRCVDSILAQTFRDIEVILVDDGSTDSSGKICDEYSKIDDRIVVFHKENGGVSSARNLGLEHARGKYVMFCDSDDEVMPEWCSKMRDAVGYDLLPLCGYYEVKNHEHEIIRSGQKASVELLAAEFLTIRAMPVWRGIYSRERLRKEKIRFDEKFSYAEDRMFNLDYMMKAHRFVFMEEPLYRYYIYDESLSHKKYLPEYLSSISAVFEKEEFFLKALPEWDEQNQKMYYSGMLDTFCAAINNAMRNEKQSIFGKIKEIQTVLDSRFFARACQYANPEQFNKIYFKLLNIKKAALIWLFLKAVDIKRFVFKG